MPRDVNGAMTLVSGNPVVAGTTISADVHNATLADIRAEIEDSLSRSGKGGMSVPFKNADGSVAAPGVSFASDTDTGLYRKGADTVAVAVGGAELAEFKPNTVTLAAGSTLAAKVVTAESVTASGAVAADSLTTTANANVGGSANVTGAVAAASASISGDVAAASATISGSVTIGGDAAATQAYATAAVSGSTQTAKAWGVSSLGESLALLAGHNCSVSVVSGNLRVTFGTPMSSENYAAIALPHAFSDTTTTGTTFVTLNRTTAYFDVKLTSKSVNDPIFNSTPAGIVWVVFGA